MTRDALSVESFIHSGHDEQDIFKGLLRKGMLKGLQKLMISLCFIIPVTWANADMLQKPEVQAFMKRMESKQHFEKKYLKNVFQEAQFKPDIIEKITRPYETKPWDVYRNLFLTVPRINEGVDFWKKHATTLKQAERIYGVPSEIIVGILGVETIYGRQQGSYRVLDALSTLAFYFPKRAAYFGYELEQYLLMCRKYHLNPAAQLGSYAGAMGQGQFMPGSYLRWAVKYTGEGAPDIIHNADDAIFSIANYLQKHGWHPSEKITQKAEVSSKHCSDIAMNAKKAEYTFKQLVRCGVKPIDFYGTHPRHAGLLALDTQNGPEYWIGYPNFYVILTYNSSPLYGLAVFLLGQSIAEKI